MLSIDTNILYYGLAEDRPEHAAAFAWLLSLDASVDVALSEFVLVELYRLLRNPVVNTSPLSAAQASGVIQQYRSHPKWRIFGVPHDGRGMHDRLWQRAAARGFPSRRVYDLRLALSLLDHGVDRFATRNVKDFKDLGFREVLNPLP